MLAQTDQNFKVDTFRQMLELAEENHEKKIADCQNYIRDFIYTLEKLNSGVRFTLPYLQMFILGRFGVLIEFEILSEAIFLTPEITPTAKTDQQWFFYVAK